jgi:4a-hydroxytetrahydrobiopterin dehydratase
MNVLTVAELVAQRCQPLEGHAAMTAAEVAAQLAALPHWSFDNGAIQRRYAFPDFHRTMAFVNALAWVAHAEDHHPDLAVSYGHCTVRFNTHSVGGISVNDFICAAKLDALVAAQ